VQRKLTAILSADIVGYSGLMERDEQGTLDRLKANRKTVFDPHVATHGGRIVKLMGDGALVEFTSVVAAITCALEIQHAMAAAEPALPDDERLRYRIGINLGDVIVDGDDIYGEGVNVAARLQTLAPVGGIACSGIVRDQVDGKVQAEFDDLGEHTVKNIERPVRVYATRAGTHASKPRTAPAARVSICVLPFANMSGDPEQEYFSDGVTEDIITDLSKVSALAVVSRNTAFTFKAKNVGVGHVARQLNVSHVLEGSVRKSGNRVRITAQLIEGSSDSHMWAERYDRDLNDIFALQDEISQAIVHALKLKLLPGEKTAIEARSTTNAEAYKIFLMARQYSVTGSERHEALIARLCQRAVEIDPNYARAWAMLAITQSRLIYRGISDDNGGAAAERALAIDPNLAEAHSARGHVLFMQGQSEEGLAEHAIALKLDPESYEVNKLAARAFLLSRRYEEAIRHFEKASALMESDFGATSMLIQCYTALGDLDAAKAAARRALARIEKIIAAEPEHGSAMGHGAGILALLGETERAKEWATRALLLDPTNTNLRYNLACAMAIMNDAEGAIDLLEELLDKPTDQIVRWAEGDNDLDSLREHPRFKALMAAARAKLPG